MVTCFSTSSGTWPGKSVMTDVWTSATSGKSSMGRELNATMPLAMNSATSSSKNKGWCSANATIRLTTRHLAALRPEERIEQQRAVRDDTLARLHATLDHESTLYLTAQLHLAL